MQAPNPIWNLGPCHMISLQMRKNEICSLSIYGTASCCQLFSFRNGKYETNIQIAPSSSLSFLHFYTPMSNPLYNITLRRCKTNNNLCTIQYSEFQFPKLIILHCVMQNYNIKVFYKY